MAVLQSGVGFTSTTDATSFSTGVFSGITRALMIVFAIASDCVVPRPIVTDAVVQPNQVGFTQVGPAVAFGPSIHSLYCFVGNRLVPNNANRNVTVNTAPTTATASIIQVVYVSGMIKEGLAAIRQFAFNPNGSGGVAPTATFPVPMLTSSAYLATMANLANPNNSAGPFSAGNVTIATLGIDTPTVGLSCYAKNGLDTSTTLTWGAPSVTAWGTFALELDTQPFTAQDNPPLVAGWGGTR